MRFIAIPGLGSEILGTRPLGELECKPDADGSHCRGVSYGVRTRAGVDMASCCFPGIFLYQVSESRPGATGG